MTHPNTGRQLSQNCPTTVGHHPCPNLSHHTLGHPLTCGNTPTTPLSQPNPLGHPTKTLFPQVSGLSQLSPLTGGCRLRLTHTSPPPKQGPANPSNTTSTPTTRSTP